ncbi:MAG TPA: membrane protein insertase YidC [Chitinophagales bacterium]|nr:membrane protein insertase YidC [Chitinophagales bacterium]
MDRNTVIGFVLIALLIIAYTYFNTPSAEQLKQKHKEDSIALVQQHSRAPGTDSLQQVNPSDTVKVATASPGVKEFQQIFPDTTNQNEEQFTIENEVLKLTLSNRGGKVVSVELKKFRTYDHKPLVLFTPENTKFDYTFFAGTEKIETNNLPFKPESTSFSVAGKDSGTFTFRAYNGASRYLEQKYVMKGNSYMVDYSFSMVGMDSLFRNADSYVSLAWDTKYNRTEKDLSQERTYSSVYFRTWNDDVNSISERSTGEMHAPGKVQWVSGKTHFFNCALIAKNPFDQGDVSSQFDLNATDYVKELKAALVLPYDSKQKNVSFPMQFYFGPNNWQELKKFDIELEQVIPIGAGLFGFISSPLNKFFFIPLFNFLNNYFTNYGLIILIMTLLLRIILFPLTYRSFVSAAKMRVLKPEIDELKAKYGDDQAKFGQEQMKLFKQAGVSPLGGCLPLLLQLPILAAMYTFFPQSIELRQQPFWWVTDLSTYDSIYTFHTAIPFYGNHISLWTIIMTVTSIGFAVYNNQLSGVTGQMKWMAYIMPVMLLGIFNSLPAALTYYYSLSNVIAFLQQFLVKNFIIDEQAIHRQIQENKKKPVKKSSWAKRLEDLQRAQQQRQKGK